MVKIVDVRLILDSVGLNVIIPTRCFEFEEFNRKELNSQRVGDRHINKDSFKQLTSPTVLVNYVFLCLCYFLLRCQ